MNQILKQSSITPRDRERDDYLSALHSLQPSDCQVDDYVPCLQCSANPCESGRGNICKFCFPNIDLNNKCFDCVHCVATRAYLQKTAEDFVLKGYQSKYGVEIWQCKTCGYCFSVQNFAPSIRRDYSHEEARKSHKKYFCENLKSGKMSM